ncbi:MAG: PDZ domain-containing protein [Phycisphaerales bacterium]|nr:PDZ domain-containing protein [Phycisphaerales bacterium]
MKSQFRMIVGGTLVAVLSLVKVAFAFQAATPNSNVAAWSDATWDAARRGDTAAFDAAIANSPSGDTASLKVLHDAIDLYAAHQVEQEKTRAESVITRRKELVDELAKNNLTKAMIAAANLKFLLDNEAWKLELKSNTVMELQSKGQATYLEALKDSDWLLAQEMLFRLRALYEDGGDATQLKKLTDQLDDCGDRVQLLAEYAPKHLYDLRKKQNDRFKAMEALEPKAEMKDAVVDEDAVDPNDPEGELSTKATAVFPEYNAALIDGWKDQFQGISVGMLKEGLRKAATEHIENGGWKPLLEGGIEALRLLATTTECQESFPALSDQTKLAAWITAIDKAAASVTAATRETSTSVLFREVISQLLAANDVTVAFPEEVVLHEFGEGAMGVLSRRFEDNYSALIWPEATRRFRQQVDGNFVGVGIMIRHDEKRDIQIINPLEGSPASRVGLKPNDRIIAVDGQSTTGWALTKAVDLITGPEGEIVTLTIRRPNVVEPFDVSMKRENIKIRSVNGWNKKSLNESGNPTWEWYMDPTLGIGYVRLTSFNEDSFTDFITALKEMRTQRKLNGLILDLRGNPGGLLSSAVDFCNLWVEVGVLVSTENRFGITTSSKSAEANRAELKDLPVAVLVNQSSASASEILSGCLQAYDKAVIVGERSFGKGSVQEVNPLADRGKQAAVKITTQHYVLPPEVSQPEGTKGRLVHKKPGSNDWGVNPDLRAKMTPDQIDKSTELRLKSDTVAAADDPKAKPRPDPNDLFAKGLDPQLEMALLAMRARVVKDAGGTEVAGAPKATTETANP